MTPNNSAAIAAALALAGGFNNVDPTEVKKLDDTQVEDEKKFLSTLTGEPERIWRRRIGRGLTQEELDFIREKLWEGRRRCSNNCGGCACHISPPCIHCIEHVNEDEL